MNFASVCTGIGAPEMAWKDLPNWSCQWMAEIEAFPSKVLKYYYPDVPNLGDMTKLNENEHYNQSTIDLLVGGTPCQSFSIAGLRGGMADQRGNLSIEYCRILLTKQPKWFIWENVPGVLSSFSDAAANTNNFHSELEPGYEYSRDVTETSDFATLLTAFRECGYSVSFRIFDSKHFGVPQRRRRVFVIGHIGNDWRPSTAVLFERDSLRRDFTPGKEKRKRTTGTSQESVRSYGIKSTAIGRQPENGGNGLGISKEVADTLTKGDRHAVVSFGTDLSQRPNKISIYENEMVTITKGGTAPGHKAHVFTKWPADLAPTLNTYFGTKQGLENQHIDSGAPLFVPFPSAPLVSVSLTKGANQTTGFVGEAIAMSAFHVRRLTPLECGRLQGFPDGYGNIPGASDTALYAAFGNSMTVHVMKWIGERIDRVDKLLKSLP